MLKNHNFQWLHVLKRSLLDLVSAHVLVQNQPVSQRLLSLTMSYVHKVTWSKIKSSSCLVVTGDGLISIYAQPNAYYFMKSSPFLHSISGFRWCGWWWWLTGGNRCDGGKSSGRKNGRWHELTHISHSWATLPKAWFPLATFFVGKDDLIWSKM